VVVAAVASVVVAPVAVDVVTVSVVDVVTVNAVPPALPNDHLINRQTFLEAKQSESYL